MARLGGVEPAFPGLAEAGGSDAIRGKPREIGAPISATSSNAMSAPMDCCKRYILGEQRLPIRRRHDQVALLAKGDVCISAEDRPELPEHPQRELATWRCSRASKTAAGCRRPSVRCWPRDSRGRARSERCGGRGMRHPCSESRRRHYRRCRRRRSRHLRYPRFGFRCFWPLSATVAERAGCAKCACAIGLASGTAFA